MTRFVDKYLSSRIQGWPVSVVPNFSTQITQVDSGAEGANARWADAIRDISIPQGFRDYDVVEALKRHWLVMRGPAHTWPWRDPTDYATIDLDAPGFETVPTFTLTDQQFGTGDGVTTQFQLTKTYDLGSPGEPYVRNIHFPVLSGLLIGVNGVAPGALSPVMTYTITRPGGIVTFSYAPPAAAVLTWGGLFDLNVRFADDESMRAIMQTVQVGGFADIPLVEVPYCQD